MFTRKANPMNTYAQIANVAQEIQEQIEDASGLIEMNHVAIKNVMALNPSIKTVKNQIDSDLFEIYGLVKELEKKCVIMQKLIKG